jgi:adenosine deaminase
MNYQTLAKVELHRHLEGSLRLDTLVALAKQHGQELPATTPEALSPYAQVLKPMESLFKMLFARSKRLSVSLLRRLKMRPLMVWPCSNFVLAPALWHNRPISTGMK